MSKSAIVLFAFAALAASACSGGKKEPTSPANNVSSASQIPAPCPAGTSSYTDASGKLVGCNPSLARTN